MSRNKYTTKGPGDLPEPTDDPRSPAYDSSHDEAVEDRKNEIVSELLTDERFVRDSLSYFFTIGSEDQLEDAINRFFNRFDASSNEKMAEAALELFDTLYNVVNTDATEEAQTRVDREIDEARTDPRDYGFD